MISMSAGAMAPFLTKSVVVFQLPTQRQPRRRVGDVLLRERVERRRKQFQAVARWQLEPAGDGEIAARA